MNVLKHLLIFICCFTVSLSSCAPYSEGELEELKTEIEKQESIFFIMPVVVFDGKEKKRRKEIEEETPITKEKILRVTLSLSAKNLLDLDFEELYQYTNTVAISIDILNLPHDIIVDGEIKKPKMYEKLKLLDLSRFKHLHGIQFSTFPIGYGEELSVMLEDVKQIGLLDIKVRTGATNNGLDLPNSIMQFEYINVLRLSFSGIMHTFPNITLPEDFHQANIKKFIFTPSRFYEGHDRSNIKYYMRYRDRIGHYIYRSVNTSPKWKKQYPKLVSKYFEEAKVAGEESQRKLYREIFKMKSLEEIRVTEGAIDSIPSTINQLTKLKTLQFSDCYIRYIPKEIRKLKSLETFKLYFTQENANIELPYVKTMRDSLKKTTFEDINTLILANRSFDKTSWWILPDIEVAGKGGFSGLKYILFYNVPFQKFPDFSGAKRLEQVMYFGDNRVQEFPDYLAKAKHLSSLIWRKTNIKHLPDALNKRPLKILQLDDNQLTSIENILDVAAHATYFSYDVNAIPYQERNYYNKLIAEKRGVNSILIEETEEQLADLDTIFYGFRENRIRKEFIKGTPHGDFNLTTLNRWRSTDFIPYTESDLADYRRYLSLIDQHQFIYKDFYRIPRVRIRAWWHEQLEHYTNLIATYDTLKTYPWRYPDRPTLLLIEYRGLHHEYAPRYFDFDFGRFIHLREIVSVANEYNQSAFNSFIKAKNLRVLKLGGRVKYIPECFCELEKLEYFELGEVQITSNNLTILEDNNIQYPSCMKNMWLDRK